ncbi:MAG: DUF4848 domain-containing protein, partial [Muribaculaceae bacterium]|nr:DUF4848 domain-containing protein [Muribaculaceae bacterium]
MLKKSFMVLLFLVVMLTSCAHDDEPEVRCNELSGAISRVIIADGKMLDNTRSEYAVNVHAALRFENEEALKRFCGNLTHVDRNYKDLISQSLGVMTLSQLEKMANEALDSIGEMAKSESEFKAKYDLLIRKYEDYLLTNHIDLSDLTFYAPQEEGIVNLKYAANIYGEYVIGDKVYSISSKNLPYHIQLLSTNNTYSDSNPVNTVTFSPAKDKKVKFLIEKDKNDVIGVSMWVKKKMWYGWTPDDYRWLLFEPELINYTPSLVPYDNIFWFRGRSDIYQEIGKGLSLQIPAANPPVVKGRVFVWTDYSFEYDSNG